MPSVEELALRVEARQKLDGLDRPLRRPPLTDGIQTGPDGRRDATPDHPLYGRYLAEWMETNRPDAGRALIGLFRSTLGELRAAISKSGSSDAASESRPSPAAASALHDMAGAAYATPRSRSRRSARCGRMRSRDG